MQNRPELPALHQLLAQALEQRGRQMQLAWRAPGATFTLVLVYHLRSDPRWCLYREVTGKRELVFDYSSCDVLLVMNLITSSCSELQRSGRSPFLVGNRSLGSAAPEPAATGQYGTLPTGEYPAFNAAPQSAAEAFGAQSPAPAGFSQPSSNQEAQPFAGAIDHGETIAPVEAPNQSSAKRLVSKAADKIRSRSESGVHEAVAVPDDSMTLVPRTIDMAAIQSVMVSLRRRDSGMFMYPAFLYFLEQEYFRSLRSRASLSVMLIELREVVKEGGQSVRKPLQTTALVDAILRISELKRHVDVLAHYEPFDCALLLPNTRSVGARSFAERLITSLTDKPLAGLAPGALSLSIGCGCVPEDFVELGKLLGAAELSLRQARCHDIPLVVFNDIKESVVVPEKDQD